MPQSNNFPYTMDYLFSYTADLEKDPEVIGVTAEGLLINFYVTGGQISGPKLNGQLRHEGGDWYVLRTDGIGISDVRATFQSEDNALIYTAYTGLMDLGADGYNQFLHQGKMADTIPIRVTPRYHTAAPTYLWLNRLQCIGVGQIDNVNKTVSYDVYAVQ